MSRFKIISQTQFTDDLVFAGHFSEPTGEVYKRIKLPQRSTSGAAGYDFVSPIGVTLEPGKAVNIPTGVAWIGDEKTFLSIVPRSGLGFKYQMQLANTIGIVDADYILSDNEGHIHIKIVNRSVDGKTLVIEPGDRIAQGIIMPYLTVDDDEATEVRNGGFGSTGK